MHSVSLNETNMMATAALNREDASNEALRSTIDFRLQLGWVLLLPLLFFSVHGAFSFQLKFESIQAGLPDVATHHPGFVGRFIFPGIVYSIVFWLILGSWNRVVAYAIHFKMLTLLALLTICSAIWSQDPTRSALFGAFYLTGTLFAYSLVIRFQPEEIMLLVSRAGIVVCLLGLIMVTFFPQFGLVDDQDPRTIGAWRGIFIDRTNAAEEMVFMLSPAIIGWGRRFKSGQILSIVLLLAMIIKAQAVTAFIALFCFILFLACLRFCRRVEPRQSKAFVVFGSFVTAVLAITGSRYLPEILRVLGRDPTLTGRTFIWGLLLESIGKRPLLGYGFYAFWNEPLGEAGRVADSMGWTAGNAHNGILEICLQLGLFGVVIFVVTLIQALWNAWFCIRNDSSGRYDWYLGLIVLIMIYSIDAGTAVYPNELLSILYVAMCCGLAQAAWQIRHDGYHKEVYV